VVSCLLHCLLHALQRQRRPLRTSCARRSLRSVSLQTHLHQQALVHMQKVLDTPHYLVAGSLWPERLMHLVWTSTAPPMQRALSLVTKRG